MSELKDILDELKKMNKTQSSSLKALNQLHEDNLALFKGLNKMEKNQRETRLVINKILDKLKEDEINGIPTE